MTDLERELVRFTSAYENEVTSALINQIENMTEAAKEAQDCYEVARDQPPVAVEAKGGTINITPAASGYLRMAEIFTQSAEKAQHALYAFGALAGKAGEL